MAKSVVLLGLLGVLLIPSPASAHRPIFSDKVATDPNTAVLISQPAISQVIYREITDEAKQVWLAFDSTEGFGLFTQIGGPVLDRLKEFRPAMLVVGPGLPEDDLPFKLPENVGAKVFPTDSVEEPRFFKEHFTGTDSWILRSDTVHIPKSGRYYVVAYVPSAEKGKLWVSVGKKESFGLAEWAKFGEWKKKIRKFHEIADTGGSLRIPILSDIGDMLKSPGQAGSGSKKPDRNASHPKSVDPPKGATLVFEEDWGDGRIDPEKWYLLRKRWGQGNNGVVPENVRVERDLVFGQSKNVVLCYGHGDEYEGPVVGWRGNRQRVGGVIVSKPFFASGQFEVVMKIGQTDRNSQSPENPTRPIGMIPAIWTYAYRWVSVDKNVAHDFKAEIPLYNPHMNRNGWGTNEYWSELDFPEFGKNQKLEVGLYNTFLNASHQSREFPTAVAIDGEYHIFTTVWRTHLLPFEGIRDDQVVKYRGYYWVQDKSISFDRYRGNPLKKLGQNRYALYTGKSATHYIDGVQVGENARYVPSMAAQLNIGVWFPEWAGKAPWSESSISIASVKVWQLNDEGDVRGILVEDIDNNMDKQGMPIKK